MVIKEKSGIICPLCGVEFYGGQPCLVVNLQEKRIRLFLGVGNRTLYFHQNCWPVWSRYVLTPAKETIRGK